EISMNMLTRPNAQIPAGIAWNPTRPSAAFSTPATELALRLRSPFKAYPIERGSESSYGGLRRSRRSVKAGWILTERQRPADAAECAFKSPGSARDVSTSAKPPRFSQSFVGYEVVRVRRPAVLVAPSIVDAPSERCAEAPPCCSRVVDA